jgi:SOS-response transcriptional repressor LexA
MSQLKPVRIATARIEAGFSSAEEFGEALGVSGQAVRDWEKGRSHPRPANLEKIMELTGKPLMYFYGGDAGNNDALAARLETLIAQVGGGPAGEMVAIPLYERASAGAGGLADEQPSEFRHIPRAWIPEGQSEDSCIYVRATGDSMTQAGIEEGELLLVCRTVPVRQGDIAVVRIEDEVVVKRVQELDGALLLVSDNPAYPVRRVDNGSVQIIGRVMWGRKDY